MNFLTLRPNINPRFYCVSVIVFFFFTVPLLKALLFCVVEIDVLVVYNKDGSYTMQVSIDPSFQPF